MYHDEVEALLGFPGQLLAGSKRTPAGCEGHTIYWNACVFDAQGDQIWWGDLDVTASTNRLQSLANQIGTIYVTPEQPWRWDGFHATRKVAHEAKRIIEFRRVA